MDDTIDQLTLPREVAAGAITDAAVLEQPEGWTLSVQFQNRRYSVSDRRSGKPHLFTIMSALHAYRDRLQLRLNAEQATSLSAEMDAYDKWFLAQVDAGLDDPGDGVSHEEVKAIFAARKAAFYCMVQPSAGVAYPTEQRRLK